MIESSLAREDENSARTLVTPVFTWLLENGGINWPTEFLRLADGIWVVDDVGPVKSLEVGEERIVPASPARLAWMIRNAHRLAPQDGRQWREYANKFLEIPGDEFRAVVGDDPRSRLGVFLLGRLLNDLDVRLRHGCAHFPMQKEAAVAVQHAAQVVESARNIDVAHVEMPMLMRLRRLLEAGPFLRWFPVPFLQ